MRGQKHCGKRSLAKKKSTANSCSDYDFLNYEQIIITDKLYVYRRKKKHLQVRYSEIFA